MALPRVQLLHCFFANWIYYEKTSLRPTFSHLRRSTADDIRIVMEVHQQNIMCCVFSKKLPRQSYSKAIPKLFHASMTQEKCNDHVLTNCLPEVATIFPHAWAQYLICALLRLTEWTVWPAFVWVMQPEAWGLKPVGGCEPPGFSCRGTWVCPVLCN